MRKPVFDIIRAQRGEGFTAEEVHKIDSLLDQLGVEKDDPAVAPTEPDQVTKGPGSASAVGLGDSAKFFDVIRSSGVFGSGLKPDQVSGMEAVLAAAHAQGWPVAYAAYALATACHETAYTMQPVREAYWLSESWRRNHLRYYPYYGRGYVQLTWRTNYERADHELKLGGSLLKNLDLAMNPGIAAKIMAKGMQEGWFAKYKNAPCTLARFLPEKGPATVDQFSDARRIINGNDKAKKIAEEAIKFQRALQAGGW